MVAEKVGFNNETPQILTAKVRNTATSLALISIIVPIYITNMRAEKRVERLKKFSEQDDSSFLPIHWI